MEWCAAWHTRTGRRCVNIWSMVVIIDTEWCELMSRYQWPCWCWLWDICSPWTSAPKNHHRGRVPPYIGLSLNLSHVRDGCYPPVPVGGGRSIVMSVSVCLRAYLQNCRSDVYQFLCTLTYGRGSILHRWCYDNILLITPLRWKDWEIYCGLMDNKENKWVGS